MAKVTIVVEDGQEGTVSFIIDPPMSELLTKKQLGGIGALSPAEYFAVAACNYAAQHSGGPKGERPSIIIKPGWGVS